MRNHLVRLLVILCIIFVTSIVASVAFMTWVYGPSYLQFYPFGPGYLERNISILAFMYQKLWYYGSWMVMNKSLLSFTASNYFMAKLFVTPIAIFGTVGIILGMNYKKLMAWEYEQKKEKIHGDARWANQDDIKKAGLRARSGMLLGQDSDGYLVAAGYQHALLFAPTGSGKGVGFVIPNLLFWEESVIVHDMKLENHEKTSGWRAKIGTKCYVWAPAQPDGVSHCYNPLDWVSKKPGQMVDDVQKQANFILPKQEFWENEARSLFIGVVLYLLAMPEKITSFGEVVRVLRGDDVAYNLAVVLDTIGKQLHPVGYMNLAAFLQKADKERSGVLSTLNSGLELWANPLIDAVTATSDFDLQVLRKEKISIYVGVTPDNLKRLEKLMQIFYQQATDMMTRKIPNEKEEPYGVLLLMDEFPTIGKMEAFRAGIAFFRGYRVRLFLVVQDTQQLKAVYEEAGMNSFLSNATYRITFAANNVETATLISQLIGNKTVESTSQSKPKFLDFNPASRSVNVSEASRALLLPQEVIALPPDDQILLIEASPPIKSKKIKYYAESFFKNRLLPPTSIPTQEPYDPNKGAMPAPETIEEDDTAAALDTPQPDQS